MLHIITKLKYLAIMAQLLKWLLQRTAVLTQYGLTVKQWGHWGVNKHFFSVSCSFECLPLVATCTYLKQTWISTSRFTSRIMAWYYLFFYFGIKYLYWLKFKSKNNARSKENLHNSIYIYIYVYSILIISTVVFYRLNCARTVLYNRKIEKRL